MNVNIIITYRSYMLSINNKSRIREEIDGLLPKLG